MESLAALLIALACTIGSFYAGVTYGKGKGYDEALENAIRAVNEVYKEEAWNQ